MGELRAVALQLGVSWDRCLSRAASGADLSDSD